jgi:hypothetical protein
MRKIYLFLTLFIIFNISNVSAITFYDKILNDNGGKDTILNKTVPDFSKVSPKTTSNYTDFGIVPSLRFMYNFTSSTCSDSYSFNEQTGKYNLLNSNYMNFDNNPDLIGKYCLTEEGNVIKVVNYKNYELDYYDVLAYRNFDENDKNVFSTVDDNGISYYYRGAIDNNWVKFGVSDSDYYYMEKRVPYYDNDLSIVKECETDNLRCEKILSKGDDLFWRIIRINGDGSIRLIYAGNTAPSQNDRVVNINHSNSAFISNSYISSADYSNVLDSYKNGRINNILNNWYSVLLNNYYDYLTSSDFCYGGNVSSTKPSSEITFSYSLDSDYYYSAHDRLSAFTPSLKCDSGVSKSNVGFISADEAMLAGLNNNNNFGNYLNDSENYLTISPEYYYNYMDDVYYYIIFAENANLSSGASYSRIGNDSGYRPVINLKSGIFVTGSGTYDDPYIPTLEDTKEETSNVIEENPKTGNTIISLLILMILTPIIIIIVKRNAKKRV